MKLWISDIKNKNTRFVKLHAEQHSGHEYLGDLNDDEIKDFFTSLDKTIDIEKNLKLLKYYGYLHLFIK